MLADDLALYFPGPMREPFAEQIRTHRLRREIIATHVTNSMVNRVGPTFVFRLAAGTGSDAGEVARAYAVARDAFDLRSLWAAVEALDNRVPASVQVGIILESKALVDRATRWLLRERYRESPEFLAALRPGVAGLAESLEEVLSGADLAALRRRQQRQERQGVPPELARRVAGLVPLGSAPEIVRLADGQGRPVPEVARVYFAAGTRFGFDWLREAAGRLAADTAWQREAVSGLVDELYEQQGELTAAVLDGDPGASAKAALDAWASGRASLVQRTKELVADLRAAGAVDLAMLSVARHQLAELVGG